jgi:hypothetical protein
MQHPPASTCDNPYCRIINAAETLNVLARYPRVRAVLSGHLHRSFDTTYGGIRFLGAGTVDAFPRWIWHGCARTMLHELHAVPEVGVAMRYADQRPFAAGVFVLEERPSPWRMP